MINEQLTQTALLGTLKKQLNADNLPPFLQKAIHNAPDSEAALLSALSAACLYEQAGWCGDSLAIPALPYCEPETQNYAPDNAQYLLAQLLEAENMQGHYKIIELLLQKYAQQQWLATPQLLNKLLALDKNVSTELLWQIIGKRGQWLLNIMVESGENKAQLLLNAANEQAAYAILDQEIWQNSPYNQRKEMLLLCRQKEANLAIQWLAHTWQSETLNEKLAFLKCLNTNLSENDLPFLTQVLAEINQIDSNKLKPKHHEIRSETAAYLAHIAQSPNHQQLCQAVLNCCTTKQGQLPDLEKNNINVQLPSLEGFWHPDNMLQQYGIAAPQNLPNEALTAHYWVALFSYVPPAMWCKKWGKSPEEVVSYWVSKPKNALLKTLSDDIITALCQAIYHYQDREMANAMAYIVMPQNKQLPTIIPKIYPILSYPDQQKLLEQGNWATNNALHQLLLQLPLHTWNLPFSRAMLIGLQAYCHQHYNYNLPPLLNLFAQCLHPQAIDEMQEDIEQKMRPENAANYAQQNYCRLAAMPIIKLYQVVQKIKSI
jgi:hypothetical protein